MVKTQLVVKRNVATTDGGGDTIVLPNVSFSAIQLHLHTVPTGTGTYVANSSFRSISLTIGGSKSIDISGDQLTSNPTKGILQHREFNSHIVQPGIAQGANFFTVYLPDVVPPGHGSYLTYQHQTYAFQGLTGTITAGSFDVTLILDSDVDTAGFYQSAIQTYKIGIGALGGVLTYYLNPLEANYLLRCLVLSTEDSGTLSDTTLTRITISRGSIILKDTTLAALKEEGASITGLAWGTGHFLVDFRDSPISVGVTDVQLKIELTAGTNVSVHVYAYATKEIQSAA